MTKKLTEDEINEALNVTEFSCLENKDFAHLGMEPTDFFHMKECPERKGLFCLIGIHPVDFSPSVDSDKPAIVKVTTTDGNQYSSKDHPEVIKAFKDKYLKLSHRWKLGGHEKVNPAKYYIDWAIDNQFEITWLDWAIEEGLYKSDVYKKKVQTDFTDREIDSMLSIIIALVKNKYNYGQHGAVSAIVLDFHKNKNGVDRKTLEKFLKVAKERL